MSWICPNCNTENTDYVIEGVEKNKCLCGYDKSIGKIITDSSENIYKTSKEENPLVNERHCGHCGTQTRHRPKPGEAGKERYMNAPEKQSQQSSSDLATLLAPGEQVVCRAAYGWQRPSWFWIGTPCRAYFTQCSVILEDTWWDSWHSVLHTLFSCFYAFLVYLYRSATGKKRFTRIDPQCIRRTRMKTFKLGSTVVLRVRTQDGKSRTVVAVFGKGNVSALWNLPWIRDRK